MKCIKSISNRFMLLGGVFLLVVGCSTDSADPGDENLTQAEVKTILDTDDAARVVDNVLSELYMNDGTTGKSAKSNECYAATYTETGYTATFNNCVLNGTDNVNGTLSVVYEASEATAAFTATFEDFYVGNIKVNGTRSYEITSDNQAGAVTFTLTSAMSLTMEDGSIIAENGTKNFGVIFGDSLETTTYSIDGNWTLEIEGNTYAINVNSSLGGNLSCGYLTHGIMSVNKNGLEVSVDFGDESCDDKATLEYPNGATEEITLKD